MYTYHLFGFQFRRCGSLDLLHVCRGASQKNNSCLVQLISFMFHQFCLIQFSG